MVICGTDKVKGVCNISSLGLQITRTGRHIVSDDAIRNNDVQLAQRLGFITCQADGNSLLVPGGETVNVPTERQIELRNICNRTINFTVAPGSMLANQSIHLKNERSGKRTVHNAMQLPPGGSITIAESTLKSKEVQSALASRLLEIVGAANPIEMTEGSVRANPTEGEMNLEDNGLETNEEVSAPNVINTPFPNPVRASEVPGPKRPRAVVWNPTGNPVIKKSSQSMVWIPGKDGKRSSAQVVETAQTEQDVVFVDKVQEAERIAKHPVLSKLPPQPEVQIEFVDQKQEAERIAKHPILGQQQQGELQQDVQPQGS